MNPAESDHVDEDAAGSVDRSAVGRASVPVEATNKIKTAERSGADDKSGRTATDDGEPGDATTGRSASLVTGAANRRPSASTSTRTSTGSIAAPAAGSAPVTVGGSAPSTGAARVAEAVRSARNTVSAAAARGPRRARLFVKRVDPWSVMKFAFAVSFVMFFIIVIATSVLYLALDSMHVFSSVNKAIAEIVGANNKNIKITAGVVIGTSGAFGLVMVVLFTALATLSAFIYNVCADLVGGIEVTLSEKE